MESPSPLSRYIPQNSKKRVFPGGTSTCMEAEVVEIPPPTNHGSKSKSLKQKEVIFPEIIDVDLDEDCGDVMLIDEKVVPSGKGKEIIDNLLSDPCDERNKGSVDDAWSSKTSGSDIIINADDLGPDSFYGDDKYLDMYYDDIVYDDEYAILQSHFDNLDIPTGIEAPIPWLVGPVANKMKSTTATTSINSTSESKLGAVGLPSGFDSLHSWTFESVQERKKKSTPGISSSSGTPLSRHGQTHSSTWPFPESAQAKSNSTTSSGFSYLNSQLNGPVNLSSGEKPPKSHRSHSSSCFKKKHLAFGATPHNSSHTDFSGCESYTTSIKQQCADDNLVNGRVPTPMIGWQGILNITGHSLGSSWVPQGSIGPSNAGHIFPKEATFSPVVLNSPSAAGTSAIASQSSSTRVDYGNPDEFMNRFQLFKTFDTVQDIFDHYYHQQGSAVKQPSKNWAKKIQEEWRILEKDLPDTIFVRVYESRMDLLRAVIVGAEGTPYHDGLFFFDVFFPSSYPNVPPKVHYHSGGLRINPNLYNCGKVCLSLLNTWNGSQKEKWIPGVSTMLQVLVSIQGLILNAKPYFNEPGYASMSGSISGEKSSLQYNERTFILSLKTMVYNIRRPPKYFEDFVAGHFHSHAHDILVACQSYIDGAQVGCLVKGGVQDVDEGDKSCSQVFRYDVANFINTLIDAFKQVGVDECEKFLPLTQRANGPRPVAPNGGAYSFYY